MKMKKPKTLTMHHLAKVTNFDSLNTVEMGDFNNMKNSAIKEYEEILGFVTAWTKMKQNLLIFNRDNLKRYLIQGGKRNWGSKPWILTIKKLVWDTWRRGRMNNLQCLLKKNKLLGEWEATDQRQKDTKRLDSDSKMLNFKTKSGKAKNLLGS